MWVGDLQLTGLRQHFVHCHQLSTGPHHGREISRSQPVPKTDVLFYSHHRELPQGIRPRLLKVQTISTDSHGSSWVEYRMCIPRHPTVEHLFLCLWHVSSWPIIAVWLVNLNSNIRWMTHQPLIVHTSMPHWRTWPAFFFASGHSKAVPRALETAAIR